MALLRSSQKLYQLLTRSTISSKQSQFVPLFLRDSPRHFCTQNEQPPQQQQQQPPPPSRQRQKQPPRSQLPSDSFVASPPQGVVYGTLMGINDNMLKTDVINMLEGCSLTLDDIKVEYNRMVYPMAMLLQFPSMSEYNTAIRDISRKGRLFKLEKVDRHEWDALKTYNGCHVLLQGIPRNAVLDDVERFLSGCNYDSSIDIFTRYAFPESIRMAVVRFPSLTEAMNAVIQKNGTFCLNNRIVSRVIQ